MASPLSIRGLGRELAERTLYEEVTYLQRMGAPLTWREDTLHVGVAASLAAVDIEVRNYGFLTDHQPLFALLLPRADSSGVILDRVFRERFRYARELLKLGARIEMLDGAIRVHPGVPTRADQTLRATQTSAPPRRCCWRRSLWMDGPRSRTSPNWIAVTLASSRT